MSEQEKKVPVGSRTGRGIRSEMEVPVNLERVLIEAGKDLAFYQALVFDSARALADRGYRLRASEQAMLSAMPQAALRKMVEQLRPEKLSKSRFAKQVATAVAGTMLFSTSACESTTAGVSPEFPADASYFPSQGIRPGLPADASFEAGIDGTGGSGGAAALEPIDASSDGSQQSDADQPIWESDSGTASRGISPDFPSDAASDSTDGEDQDGN